ncbi:MAG: (2Fe-2S)-binding protein [Zestosphaera sp.]
MTKILCICEEVTLEEVERVVKEEGIKDIETLKRRLRLGMGPCGGRYCINTLLRMYQQLFGEPVRNKSDVELKVPLSRPPTKPVYLYIFKEG